MADKYICLTCHSAFREPRIYVDDSPEYGRCETVYCPFCGGEYFAEALDCPDCGEPIEASTKLCVNCQTHLRAKFRRFRDHLSAAEIEVMDDWLDGESIESI